jgi:hypothetical protein
LKKLSAKKLSAVSDQLSAKTDGVRGAAGLADR